MKGSLKDYRVIKKDGLTFIYLDNDFILQIDSQERVEIISNEISQTTKENILTNYKNDLNSFISFLETNLKYLLAGESKNTTRLLTGPFKLPTAKLQTNNLAIEVIKNNILLLTSSSPTFEVQCKKCGARKSVVDFVECSCGSVLKPNFIPVVDSEFLGSLFPDNCVFLCFNPSNFQIVCEECGASYETCKVGIDSKFIMNCWKCDKALSFIVKKVNYLLKKTYNFKKGEQLPDRGTCKHYKKSFRWFRFPCCGSVYPCDICHDLDTNHENKLANKMICGLCSKEQSVKKDCDCGMTLKRSTSCWEGGKGNRDKQSMNKKDKKKYTK